MPEYHIGLCFFKPLKTNENSTKVLQPGIGRPPLISIFIFQELVNANVTFEKLAKSKTYCETTSFQIQRNHHITKLLQQPVSNFEPFPIKTCCHEALSLS